MSKHRPRIEKNPPKKPPLDEPNDGKESIKIPLQEVKAANPCDAVWEYIKGEPDREMTPGEVLANFPVEACLWTFTLPSVKNNPSYKSLVKEIARQAADSDAEEKDDPYEMILEAYRKKIAKAKDNAARRRIDDKFRDRIMKLFRKDKVNQGGGNGNQGGGQVSQPSTEPPVDGGKKDKKK